MLTVSVRCLATSPTTSCAVLCLRNSLHCLPFEFCARWCFLCVLSFVRLTRFCRSNLQNNSLVGQLPSQWSASLSVLDCFNNSLNGTLPIALGQCSRLKLLDLSYNSIAGSIPNIDRLTLLTNFQVQSNDLSGCVPPIPRSVKKDECFVHAGDGERNCLAACPSSTCHCGADCPEAASCVPASTTVDKHVLASTRPNTSVTSNGTATDAQSAMSTGTVDDNHVRAAIAGGVLGGLALFGAAVVVTVCAFRMRYNAVKRMLLCKRDLCEALRVAALCEEATDSSVLVLSNAGLSFANTLAQLHAAMLAGRVQLSDADWQSLEPVFTAARDVYDHLIRHGVPRKWEDQRAAHKWPACNLFFSYSGADGPAYAHDTLSAIQEALGGSAVAFLDKQLKDGEEFTRSALHTLLRCRVVCAVVSREFVTRNKWPLHELGIACARMRADNANIFTMVLDAYSYDDDGAWVESLVKLPLRYLFDAGGNVPQVHKFTEKTVAIHRQAILESIVALFKEIE
jgi:hypothetical protein